MIGRTMKSAINLSYSFKSLKCVQFLRFGSTLSRRSIPLHNEPKKMYRIEELRLQYPKGIYPALYALRSRLHIENIDIERLKECTLADMTKNDYSAKYLKGLQFIEDFVGDSLKNVYPNISHVFCVKAVKYLVNESTMEKAARRCGFHQVAELRYIKNLQYMVPVLTDTILENISEEKAKTFIFKHFMTQKIEWTEIFNLERPDLELKPLCLKKYNVEPQIRLLNESGRKSSDAIFVIGIFAGVKKIGEGFGNSMYMAQHQAFTDALIKHNLS